jgi:hypothetical protein
MAMTRRKARLSTGADKLLRILPESLRATLTAKVKLPAIVLDDVRRTLRADRHSADWIAEFRGPTPLHDRKLLKTAHEDILTVIDTSDDSRKITFAGYAGAEGFIVSTGNSCPAGIERPI